MNDKTNLIYMRNLFLASISLILGACSSISTRNSPKSTKNASLTNSYWILDDNTPGKITLFIEKDKISGNASCNNYFGGLTTNISSGNFKVNDIGVTKKVCSKMSTEQYFLSILEKVDNYHSANETLELYQGNILLLKFRKKITSKH